MIENNIKWKNALEQYLVDSVTMQAINGISKKYSCSA